MADPFDRAWDFMKNEDEDPKQSNTTGNIDPNRSSRIVDMFSGLGGRPPHPQPTEHNIQIPSRFSDLTPSHARPPMEEDYDSKLMDILEQIRQGAKPSDRFTGIHGSPPFNPSQEDYDEAFKRPDVFEGKPPAEPWTMPNPMRDQKKGQHPPMGRGQEEDKPNPYGPSPSDEEGRPKRRPYGEPPYREDPEIDRKRGSPYRDPHPYGPPPWEEEEGRPMRREPQGDHPMRQDPPYTTKKPKLGEGLIGRSKKALDEEKAERAKEKKSSDGDKDE